ncbi:inorganic phosphate transporter [Salipiger sp. HF18]|uniref:inorganic phosphate transporter n=1 Tax=Salipiger sp. HF18 TaxID=2721557 RepID=UPI00142DE8A3|nr:inorganic phosphate transporter [Salipiger sp. HF18]
MAGHNSAPEWKALDQDLGRFSRLEAATMYAARPLVGVGISLAFVTIATLAALILTGGEPGSLAVVAAAAFGAYMALNIGANDVANNMGPAVGARALPMLGAIAIAAVCESAGALLAGGDVVRTIAHDIVDPATAAGQPGFLRGVRAAPLAAPGWVNIATWIGAPVSTTHAVVGGVVGAGVVSVGAAAVNWSTVGLIATSWTFSPLLGALVAVAMLAFIEWRIVQVEDKIAAARRWVPLLIGLMAGAFTTYLTDRALSHLVDITFGQSLLAGVAVGCVTSAIAVPFVRKQSAGLENRNRSLKTLFRLPLVASAGLLSFAHGANDVANAVGPLAAVVYIHSHAPTTGEVAMPPWVLLIGALGISFGLVLFGPKLIGMVGSQITKLNPMRAYCVALSTAVTVIAASGAGLPVSSTHIAVGSVFGVGFFREWYQNHRSRKQHSARKDTRTMAPQERTRRRLVRRSHFLTIVAAWVITVPAAALLAAINVWLLQQVAF